MYYHHESSRPPHTTTTTATTTQYVLLYNAQIDSCNPKSAARLREDVVRNHKLRQQEKLQAEHAKRSHPSGASPTASLSAQMKANFERLKREIAERKANPQRVAASNAPAATASAADELTAPLSSDADEIVAPPLGLGAAPVGIWRHVYSQTHAKEFYINSVTREIRLERPPEFLQQQNPKNRYDDDFEGDTVGSAPGSTDFVDATARVEVDIATQDETSTAPPRRPPQLPRSLSPAMESEEAVVPTSADGAGSASKSSGKRPAGFFSPDVSGATQDFALSSDEDETTIPGGADRADASSSAAITASAVALSASSSTVLSEDAAKWDCPRCTLMNDTVSTQCEACGYEAKARTQLPARKRQKKMQFQSKISLG